MQFIPIKCLPLVKRGDDLGKLISQVVKKHGLDVKHGDVVVVAQSVVSKAEGNIVNLRKVKPRKTASEIAAKLKKDPREVEVILQQSSEIVRLAHVIISRTHHGFVCANAGVDHSNAGPGCVTTLPNDPDASAARIRKALKRRLGVDVAVIVTDTQGRPFRQGCVGLALGVAGMKPLLDLRGKKDLYGKKLHTTITSPADAIAAGAVSVMGEADEGTPVVLVKGARYGQGDGTVRELIRPPERDLFR